MRTKQVVSGFCAPVAFSLLLDLIFGGDPVRKWYRVAKIEQLGRSWFCHTLTMTTKTIPQYLEGKRQTIHVLVSTRFLW